MSLSSSDNSGGFLDEKPWTGPIQAVLGGFLIPILFIVINNYRFNSKNEVDDHDNTTMLKFNKFLINKCGIVLCVTIPTVLLMGLNQLSNAKWNLNYDTDISYYTRFTTPSYERYQVVNSIQDTSYGSVVASAYSSRVQSTISRNSRFIIAYHTSDWSNILTQDNLLNICATEAQIVSKFYCLDFSSFSSAIPKLTNYPACTEVTGSVSNFLQGELDGFFEDRISAHSNSASVLLSFSSIGTCPESSFAAIYDSLNSFASSGIQVNFVNEPLLNNEIVSLLENGANFLGIGLVFSTAVLIGVMRGLITGLFTSAMIVISMTTAAALLPTFGYESFSILNAMAFLIIYGIGAANVLMFHSSWRRTVKAGTQTTPYLLYETYMGIAGPFLAVVCIAIVCVFVNLASPLLFASQLGAFFGISIIVFYMEFHYVLIPLWIFLDRWQYSQDLHDEIDLFVKEMSCGMFYWNDDDEAVGAHSPAILPEPPPSVNITSIQVLQSIYDAEQAFMDPERRRDTMASSNAEWREPPPLDIPVVDSNQQVTLITRRPSFTESVTGSTVGSVTGSAIGSVLERVMSSVSSRSRANTVTDQSETDSPTASQRVRRDSIAEMVSDDGSVLRFNDSAPNITSSRSVDVPVSPRADPLLLSHEPIEDEEGNIIDQQTRVIKKDFGAVYAFRALIVFVALIICAAMVLGVYNSVHVDINTLQYYSKSTNVGNVMQLISDYKPALLLQPSPQIFEYTTHKPTIRPTASPTISKTSSRAPSSSPTFYPTASQVSFPAVFDTVSCCMGISYDKNNIDSKLYPEYDATSFYLYTSSAVHFMSDLNAFCSHVDESRENLGISPSWDVNRDCLYSQLVATAMSSSFNLSSPSYVSHLLLQWANKTINAANLLGITSSSSADLSLVYEPLWVCMNFSTQLNISSVDTDSVSQLAKRWRDAFQLVGASQSGVSLIVSASSFSEADKFLATYESLKLATILCLISVFVVLVPLIQNWKHVLIGCFGVLYVFSGMFSFYFVAISSEIDVLDIVEFTLVFCLVCHFPIYLLADYTRQKYLAVAPTSNKYSKSVSPTLSMSSFYMRHALIGPLAIVLALSIPLLFTAITFAYNMAIFAIISVSIGYLFSVILFPPFIVLTSGETIIDKGILYSKKSLIEFGKNVRNFRFGGGGYLPLSSLSSDSFRLLQGQQTTRPISVSHNLQDISSSSHEGEVSPALRRMITETQDEENHIEPSSISGRFTGSGLDVVFVPPTVAALANAETSPTSSSGSPRVEKTRSRSRSRILALRQFFVDSMQSAFHHRQRNASNGSLDDGLFLRPSSIHDVQSESDHSDSVVIDVQNTNASTEEEGNWDNTRESSTTSSSISTFFNEPFFGLIRSASPPRSRRSSSNAPPLQSPASSSSGGLLVLVNPDGTSNNSSSTESKSDRFPSPPIQTRSRTGSSAFPPPMELFSENGDSANDDAARSRRRSPPSATRPARRGKANPPPLLTGSQIEIPERDVTSHVLPAHSIRSHSTGNLSPNPRTVASPIRRPIKRTLDPSTLPSPSSKASPARLPVTSLKHRGNASQSDSASESNNDIKSRRPLKTKSSNLIRVNSFGQNSGVVASSKRAAPTLSVAKFQRSKSLGPNIESNDFIKADSRIMSKTGRASDTADIDPLSGPSNKLKKDQIGSAKFPRSRSYQPGNTHTDNLFLVEKYSSKSNSADKNIVPLSSVKSSGALTRNKSFDKKTDKASSDDYKAGLETIFEKASIVERPSSHSPLSGSNSSIGSGKSKPSRQTYSDYIRSISYGLPQSEMLNASSSKASDSSSNISRSASLDPTTETSGPVLKRQNSKTSKSKSVGLTRTKSLDPNSSSSDREFDSKRREKSQTYSEYIRSISYGLNDHDSSSKITSSSLKSVTNSKFTRSKSLGPSDDSVTLADIVNSPNLVSLSLKVPELESKGAHKSETREKSGSVSSGSSGIIHSNSSHVNSESNESTESRLRRMNSNNSVKLARSIVKKLDNTRSTSPRSIGVRSSGIAGHALTRSNSRGPNSSKPSSKFSRSKSLGPGTEPIDLLPLNETLSQESNNLNDKPLSPSVGKRVETKTVPEPVIVKQKTIIPAETHSSSLRRAKSIDPSLTNPDRRSPTVMRANSNSPSNVPDRKVKSHGTPTKHPEPDMTKEIAIFGTGPVLTSTENTLSLNADFSTWLDLSAQAVQNFTDVTSDWLQSTATNARLSAANFIESIEGSPRISHFEQDNLSEDDLHSLNRTSKDYEFDIETKTESWLSPRSRKGSVSSVRSTGTSPKRGQDIESKQSVYTPEVDEDGTFTV